MAVSKDVLVPVNAGEIRLEGILDVPEGAGGLVIFAHGSGSSRLSPRNGYVAGKLRAQGLGTLLFDLLTMEEAADRANVFDIPLLASRVGAAVSWAAHAEETRGMTIGVFGSSTGAAAALVAAADFPETVGAVVSRGGRPDMAVGALGKVRAPVLLIVGGADYGVIELNEAAFERLGCEKRLDIVPGATHLFEEPGALDDVVERAAAWFVAHLGGAKA